MKDQNEKQFYNAFAIGLKNDWKALTRLIGLYGAWSEAWAQEPITGVDPESDWAKLAPLGIELILQNDASYPPLLKEIYQPPLGLYIKGSLAKITSPAIAVVGTRKATPKGLESAKKFGREISLAGLPVVSGLALGVDTYAHMGALDGGGATAAVLACGLDQVYPAQNKSLAERIIKNNGVLISEYPIGAPSLPYRFIERNRIVSGLTKATIVIEAPEASGALATARFAMEQNRDVGALPGPIGAPNYAGNHSLLKSGAALITETSDILALVGAEPQSLFENLKPLLNPEEQLIFETLKNLGAPAGVDKIIELGKIEPPVAQRALSFLLLKDIIIESSGKYELK